MNKRLYVYIFIFLSSVLVYYFLEFTSTIEYHRQKTLNRADVIIVLTGGSGRNEAGLELLRKGYGKVLILSGVALDAVVDEIFLKGLSAVERDNIILEKNSKSTYENAIEVKRLVKEKGMKSIVLITNAYHMKRALYVFKRIMPNEVRIEPRTVESPNYDSNRWWKARGGAIAAGEFIKYYWYCVRFLMDSPE